jgi:hypothetical protein
LPGPPIEENASHAPIVPGSTATGTAHRFQLELQNPDGSTGPAGDLRLDPSRPVVVDLYLSAGPSGQPLPDPAWAGPGPGAAPSLTVEASLEIADRAVGPQRVTETLVSAPGQDPITRHRLTFPLEQGTLPAGAGLGLDLEVYQVEEGDQQATQPQWRIHTGSQHPSGLTVPMDASSPSRSGVDLSLQQTDEASREQVRTGAWASLVGAFVAAGWATRRGYRELRDD